MFVRGRDGARPVVVDIGHTTALPESASADGHVPGGRYYLAHLAPSPRLQDWAQRHAQFRFSPLGTPCVWLNGKLHAAVQHKPLVEQLTEDERAYLDAYLTILERSWNDPDVPQGVEP